MIQTDDFGQDMCVECGACVESCPSARNGGISPVSAVIAYRDGTVFSDEWRCLQCNRCDAACPEGVCVTRIVRAFRNDSYRAGKAPERFLRAEKQFLSDLKMYPIIGRTVNQRSELGLATVPIDPKEEGETRSVLKEVWGNE